MTMLGTLNFLVLFYLESHSIHNLVSTFLVVDIFYAGVHERLPGK
jgi:hypothetical protein